MRPPPDDELPRGVTTVQAAAAAGLGSGSDDPFPLDLRAAGPPAQSLDGSWRRVEPGTAG